MGQGFEPVALSITIRPGFPAINVNILLQLFSFSTYHLVTIKLINDELGTK